VIPAGKHTAVAFRPDGKLVAATGSKATGFFDPASRQTVPVKPVVPGGTAVAFDPLGGQIAVSDGLTTFLRQMGGDGGRLTISGPRELGNERVESAAGLAWSPDGKTLAYIHPLAKGKRAVGLHEPGPDRRPKALAGYEGPIQVIAWAKDGKLIATAGRDGRVVLWDGTTSKELRWGRFVGRDGGPTQFHGLAFSPDGKTLAAAVTLGSGKSADRILLIDTADLDKLENLFPPVAPVRSVAFSPDGKLLVAACGIDREKVKPLMTPDEMKAAGAVVVWERKP
jgi:WD40 repeat protein